MADVECGEPRPVAAVTADLGESPVWDPRAGLLHWVDLPAGRRFATDPDTGRTVDSTGRGPCGFIALAASGVLFGEDTRVLLETPAGSRIVAEAAGPAQEARGLRLNDSQVAPGGFLMAGLMEVDRERRRGGRGRLVRISGDGEVTLVAAGLDLPNGMGWSPDDRTMYHVDMGRSRVDAWDYEPASGGAAARRTALDLAGMPGLPDGMCVDAEGRLWIACYGTPTVRCFEPDGRPVTAVELPVPSVTSCAFGGPAMDLLFVTTTSRGAGSEHPLAGRTLAVPTSTRGRPAAVFPR